MENTMENTVTERIKLIMSEFGLSERQFSIRIGKKQQTVNAMFKRDKSDIMLTTIVDILNAFPTIDTDWFVKGEGQMFKKENGKSSGAVEEAMKGRIEDLREQVAELKADKEALKEDKERLLAEIAELKAGGYGYIAAEKQEYGKKGNAV